ncbi:hypothetical protein ROZALSC1DRAFT_31516 [Rozella allomycis CSF55]|uniref:Zinc finger, FYVE/PHD-type domain-containing protein n=1 Tax=Rozella allomycis (strain CSF55) TaxID=988480 RepID=A0A075B1U7_ROZAC|nr:Zinc finger, FYVE/PHD-type domain-containing protein [Rozella allomycis CSF55]RKP16568.1 hypothetical protein ROZALSC1DRAFT_31516 [Rozella allomycis CSF55]|eukprot:EPZ34768.1 Zinc finger, FYVE/PHD-type domain-containing protein [Rozella allomycis CSF55]
MNVSDLLEDLIEINLSSVPNDFNQSLSFLASREAEFEAMKYSELIYKALQHIKVGEFKNESVSGPSDSHIIKAKVEGEKYFEDALNAINEKISTGDAAFKAVYIYFDRDKFNKVLQNIDEELIKANIDAIPEQSEKEIKSNYKRKKSGNLSTNETDVYCICQQPSYGEMIGCDGESCSKEWFHYDCVGLTKPPVGKWYCTECLYDRMYSKINMRK